MDWLSDIVGEEVRGVMRVEERFLMREHGDLILPVKSVVTQLRDPFIKQLLGLDLQAQGDHS